MVDRGYSLNRGKGQKRYSSPRGICPTCNKKGLSTWKVLRLPGAELMVRDCRYCRNSLSMPWSEWDRMMRDRHNA